MMNEIDLRFKSGNEVPVTWARIHVEEWENMKALAELAILAMMDGDEEVELEG